MSCFMLQLRESTHMIVFPVQMTILFVCYLKDLLTWDRKELGWRWLNPVTQYVSFISFCWLTIFHKKWRKKFGVTPPPPHWALMWHLSHRCLCQCFMPDYAWRCRTSTLIMVPINFWRNSDTFKKKHFLAQKLNKLEHFSQISQIFNIKSLKNG